MIHDECFIWYLLTDRADATLRFEHGVELQPGDAVLGGDETATTPSGKSIDATALAKLLGG
jgi:hypothetical protein